MEQVANLSFKLARHTEGPHVRDHSCIYSLSGGKNLGPQERCITRASPRVHLLGGTRLVRFQAVFSAMTSLAQPVE